MRSDTRAQRPKHMDSTGASLPRTTHSTDQPDVEVYNLNYRWSNAQPVSQCIGCARGCRYGQGPNFTDNSESPSPHPGIPLTTGPEDRIDSSSHGSASCGQVPFQASWYAHMSKRTIRSSKRSVLLVANLLINAAIAIECT
jgi:hypothetical protein